MAQVVMKDEKPKTFQNNSQHKSTTYRTRQVEIQEDKEPSNEQMSSEGEHEQDDDPEECFTSEKSVMRIGLEKGLIKKLHPEQREKDRESVTPGEKKKKKIEPEKFMDEAIQKGKIIRKIMIGSKTFNAILDTGSEITLIKMGMQPEGALEEKALTKIKIMPAIGPPSIAYLISVEAKLIEDGDEENDNGGAFIVCAVSDALNGDEILLSPADYDVLKRSNNNIKSQNNILVDTNLLAEGKNTNESDLQESARLANLIEIQMMHKYEVKAIQSGQILKTLESFNHQEEEGTNFEKMQREDTSLQKYWDMVGG